MKQWMRGVCRVASSLNQFEPAELDKGTFHGLEVQDLSLKTLGQTLTVRVRTR